MRKSVSLPRLCLVASFVLDTAWAQAVTTITPTPVVSTISASSKPQATFTVSVGKVLLSDTSLHLTLFYIVWEECDANAGQLLRGRINLTQMSFRQMLGILSVSEALLRQVTLNELGEATTDD